MKTPTIVIYSCIILLSVGNVILKIYFPKRGKSFCENKYMRMCTCILGLLLRKQLKNLWYTLLNLNFIKVVAKKNLYNVA